jgi:DNA-binding response OmpR family regulator
MDQTVLIVDDDADLLQLASLIFKKAGAQVITANDGLDGISKFFTYHPDLIILDVMMPGNNGFDICHQPHHGRNGNGGTASFSYNDGYLSIDIERHEVLIHGKRIKLTPVEFRLLVYLARNAGKLLTFDKLLVNVWGNEYLGSMEHVHVYISHLRRKIEQDARQPRYIITVHGVGYIFEKQEIGFKT